MWPSHRVPSLTRRHSPHTTDQIIEARQKKLIEDAFVSSQLVELGLLSPQHAVGKRPKTGKDKGSRGLKIRSRKGESPGEEDTVKGESKRQRFHSLVETKAGGETLAG